MEIIRSTDFLEKEVLEDGRKKAQRILEKAEKEIQCLKQEYEEKARAEEERLGLESELNLKAIKNKIESTLPLEFLRQKVVHADSRLREHLDTFLDQLTAPQLLEIMRALLRRAGRILSKKRLRVSVGGFAAEEARKLLAAEIPEADLEAVKDDPALRGLEIESADGRIRYHATLATLKAILLDEKREALITSLLKDG